jgi:hypothetical protein
MQKLTKKQQWMLEFLQGYEKLDHEHFVSPTEIGHLYGVKALGTDKLHSSTASPTLIKLVKMELVERNSKGHYRIKQIN